MAEGKDLHHSQDTVPAGPTRVREDCGNEHARSPRNDKDVPTDALVDLSEAKDDKKEAADSEAMDATSSVDPTLTTSANPASKDRRCIILVGKPGSGKRTIVKEGLFPNTDVLTIVSRSSDGKTENAPKETIEYKGKIYSVLLIEDIDLMRQYRRNPKVAQKFFRKYGAKIASDVLLIMFVYRHGRFTQEEKDVFDLAITSFMETTKDVCALVITNCESLSGEAKEEAKMEFKNNPNTRKIYEFMGKGIHCVGFPDVESLHPGIKQAYQSEIEISRHLMQTLLLTNEHQYKNKMDVMNTAISRSTCGQGYQESSSVTGPCQIM